MSMFDNLPVKVGDRVIDDNGETGTVYSMSSSRGNARGELVDWAARIRFDWNMPSYGKERRVGPYEISLLTDGEPIDLRDSIVSEERT